MGKAEKGIRPLSSLSPGEEGIVKSYLAGIGMERRLSDMGLREGVRVRMVSDSGGPVCVVANESRIALGHGMAGKILVHLDKEHYDEPRVLTLADAVEGDTVRVKTIRGGSAALRQRLLGMGITRGTELKVIRYAPLRDPIEIVVKGYALALRVAEGRMIQVEKAEQIGGISKCTESR